MKASKKHPRQLKDGPYQGETVYLSDDATSTLTFGTKGYYGRYTASGTEMYWRPMKVAKEVRKGAPRRTRSDKARTRRVLQLILGERAA